MAKAQIDKIRPAPTYSQQDKDRAAAMLLGIKLQLAAR